MARFPISVVLIFMIATRAATASAAAAAGASSDLTSALLVGREIAGLFQASPQGQMIISALGDGNQCLDAGNVVM
jgi:hypothetical protein